MKSPTVKFTFDQTLLKSLRSSVQEDQVLEFDLFLIGREIKQTTQELSKINLLSAAAKQTWLAENETLVTLFMSDLVLELKEIFLDLSLRQTTAQEAMSCVSRLQELTKVVDQLISTGHKDFSQSTTSDTSEKFN